MVVKIVKNGETYTMGYDPCHYATIIEFYEKALIDGEIEAYTVDMRTAYSVLR
jgi:hypothetical protein